LVCFILLLIILIAGTIYGIFIGSPFQKNRDVEVVQKNSEGQTFTGIGQIRVSTADNPPGMVILLVSFIYYPDDKAFSEELALRVGDFRSILEDFLSSCSSSDLQKMGDEGIKAELLRRFNSILKLGQIDTLYFSDFLIIG